MSLPPKWSMPQSTGQEILWVATLDENHHPHPLASYVAVGDGVPRMLTQLAEIVAYRQSHPQWGYLSAALVLVCDADMDLGEPGRRIERDGERLGIRVVRTDLSRAARPGGCPDGGTCHHECGTDRSCFRVGSCGPLFGVYPGNRWPNEVLAAERRLAGAGGV